MSDQDSETQRGAIQGNGPVLVAVDFTRDSEAALLWACQYARNAGLPVIVLHVVHDPSDAPGYYRRGEEDPLRPMEDVALEMMDRFLQEVADKHPDLDALGDARKVLLKGIPATRILEVAENTGASLIVVGSRGRTGLPHLLLGSKAERVAQLSPIPVTIVKARPPED